MRFLVAALFGLALGSTILLPHSEAHERKAPPSNPRSPLPRIQEAAQLLVVTSKTWNSPQGELRRFEARDTTWHPIADPVAVSLGRHGLAWGRGLLEAQGPGLSKREGDGRSPAGIFSLGTAFGQAPKLSQESHGYPYLAVGPSSYCVEDTRSEFYNQIIDAGEVDSKVWQKWSALARPDGLFRWGIFVEQNTAPARVGAGSCIFLHIWRGPGIGTAGCTAMPAEAISETIHWLDPQARPLLIQVPKDVYRTLASEHGLPIF